MGCVSCKHICLALLTDNQCLAFQILAVSDTAFSGRLDRLGLVARKPCREDGLFVFGNGLGKSETAGQDTYLTNPKFKELKEHTADNIST